ncbi:hypothetical protein C8F04DRAFT_1268339 [Mycena alexandri]|uniref:SMP domain-containing protein n=1 Tax=Mycena alexandri TaxID=1745969 RepID=A0AAD6SFV0_9AGAR|nr:hypothetical protein C8F04DRAFT_1268339 [Mycena alexandri]
MSRRSSPILSLFAAPTLCIRLTFIATRPTDPQAVTARAPPDALAKHIAPSKERAAKELEEVARRGGTGVFTNGSGFERGVGAAAVAMKGQELGRAE